MHMPGYLLPDAGCMLTMTSMDFVIDVLLCERGRVVDDECLATYQLPTPCPLVAEDWSRFLSWAISPFALRSIVPSLVRALCIQATSRVHRLSCAMYGTGLPYVQRRAGFLAGLAVHLSRPWNRPVGVASYASVVAKLAQCMDAGAYLAQRLDDEDDPAVSSGVLESYASQLLELGALHEVYTRQPAPLFFSVQRPLQPFQGSVGDQALFKRAGGGIADDAPLRFHAMPPAPAASAGAAWAPLHGEPGAPGQGRRDDGGAAGQGLPLEAFGLLRGHPDGGPVGDRDPFLARPGSSWWAIPAVAAFDADDATPSPSPPRGWGVLPAAGGEPGMASGADLLDPRPAAAPLRPSSPPCAQAPFPPLSGAQAPSLSLSGAQAPSVAGRGRRRRRVDDDHPLHGRLQRAARQAA